MSDLLNTAVSGLFVAQQQLATTSHNIANIGTDGYSRQRVELQAQTLRLNNRFNIGNGVLTSDINRIHDAFTTTQLRDVTSEQSRLNTFHQLASVVDDLLADPQGGITPILQNFFSGVQDLANDPNSAAARIALLDQAGALTARFAYMDRHLNTLQSDLSSRATATVNEINRLSGALFATNQDILAARGNTSGPPPDLLDRRDTLLRELSERVSIQVVEVAGGAVNVFVGQGQALLTEGVNNTLSTSLDPSDPSVLRIAVNSGTSLVDVTGSIAGGELGGIFNFRNTVIDGVRNGLGRVAVGLATLFNQQHQAGLDQNGALGGNFFSLGTPSVLTNAGNTGTATASAQISNVNLLTTNNYTLRFDGSNWTLASANASSSVVGAGPTLALDGLSVTLAGGAAVAGDSFLIKPTLGAAGSLGVAISRPEAIATGLPIRSAASLANTGSGDISTGTVVTAGNANLRDPVTLQFNTPPTTFNILNSTTGAVLAAAQPYTTGANIAFNGWQVQISGTPSANDRFSIEANTAGVSDNNNVLALANLQNTGVFDAGGTNLQEAYSEVVADVGSQTRFADINRSAQTVLQQTLNDRRESISGVNLDEEAANLVRFQQAYQAAARAISTAQEIFQTLIGSF